MISWTPNFISSVPLYLQFISSFNRQSRSLISVADGHLQLPSIQAASYHYQVHIEVMTDAYSALESQGRLLRSGGIYFINITNLNNSK